MKYLVLSLSLLALFANSIAFAEEDWGSKDAYLRVVETDPTQIDAFLKVDECDSINIHWVMIGNTITGYGEFARVRSIGTGYQSVGVRGQINGDRMHLDVLVDSGNIWDSFDFVKGAPNPITRSCY